MRISKINDTTDNVLPSESNKIPFIEGNKIIPITDIAIPVKIIINNKIIIL